MPSAHLLFGRNVRLVREAAKMSRRELATAAGISQRFVEKLELGYLRPSPETVKALASALGVSIKYLGQRLARPPRPRRPDEVGLAKVVRAARSAAGMSREKLAKVVGIRPGFLMDIEMGRRRASTGTLAALATALHVPEAKLRAAGSRWQPNPIGAVI